MSKSLRPMLEVCEPSSTHTFSHQSPGHLLAAKAAAIGLISLIAATSAWAGKPVPPIAPAGLTATALSTSSIKLAWQDKSTDETGFRLDRAASPSGPWTVNVATVGANVTAYTATGLAPSTTYYYRVYAYNKQGNSAYSTVAGATTLSQGVPCTFSLSTSSASFNSSAANGSVGVTTAAGCTWTAVSGAGWISVTSGASGNGSGTVNYSLAANTGSSSRSGTITIAGQIFTVSQNGNIVNMAPVANAGPDLSITLGNSVSVSASGSYDPDGSISSYQWDFGDGSFAYGFSVSHAYSGLGVYTIRLTVTDNLGATGTDTALATVVGLADLTPPTVVLGVPGSPNVSGTITLNATALDNVGVAKVEFYRDGTLFSTLFSAPFSAGLDTRTLANSSHTLVAKAYDGAGNNASSSVTVLVDNAAPTASLTAPSGGSTVSGTVALSANANDNAGGTGVSKVEFYCDNASTPLGTATAAPYSAPCDTTSLANGSHSFYCKAYDAAGNSANSAGVTVTVSNSGSTGTPGQMAWVRTMQNQNGNAVVTSVAADHSGNQIAAGYFNGTVDFGTGPMNSIFANNVTDAFIAKYNSQGTLLWVKRIGGSGNDSVQSIVIDSQNNILVAGNFQATVDFGGTLMTAVTSSELFVVKLSASGSFLWGNHYSGLTSNTGKSMALDASDNLIVAANCGYNANFGGFLLTPAGGAADIDVALGKLSGSNGSTVWARRFGGVNWDYVRAVAVDRSGDVAVTGYFTTSTDLGGGTLNGGGSYDIFLARYSGADGSFRWGKTIGGSGGDFGYGLAIDPNTGNAVMTGLFSGAVNFGGGAMGGNGGVFLAAYDPAGNYLWAMTTGGGSDSGAAVTIDNSGNMAVSGRASYGLYFGGSQSALGNGQVNGFVASFGISGNNPPAFRWTKYLGATTDGASAGNAVGLDPVGDVVIGGSFLSTIDFGGTSVTAAMGGYSSAYAVKYTR